MKISKSYSSVIDAAYDFVDYRKIDRVEKWLRKARLYHTAFRSLDIYIPAKKRAEELAASLSNMQRRSLMKVIRGLNILNDARYHPCYRDHRIFPLLRQYHEAISLVVEDLESLKEVNNESRLLYEDFLEDIEKVTMGNGLYVVNWETPPKLHGIFYPTVNLLIGRLVAEENLGIYTVKVKAGGVVPHHSHQNLEEIHFLQKPIRGIHQLGGEASHASQPDMVYVPKGGVHAFRNSEKEDVTFLFICGCEKTGPWDFVQDILPTDTMEFPSVIEGNINEMGIELGSLMDTLSTENIDEPVKVNKLSPETMRLTHSVVVVNERYHNENLNHGILFYVAYGKGYVKGEDEQVSLEKGSVFTLPKGIDCSIEGDDRIILYTFEWI
jgi:quercetin dioxygenase-like cupin family protein